MTSSTSFHLRLLGRAPAILVTPVNVLSSRVRHRLVSRRSRRLRIRKFVLPTRYLVWCAEQALRCPTKAVGLTIIFPEDLGGSQDGPSSVWTLREFQVLEGIRDARRAAGHLCQITGAHYKRPLGVFFHVHLRSRLSLGWPCLEKLRDKLVYKGPLPVSCHCGRGDSPLIGVTDTADFITSTSIALAPSFGISSSSTTHWERDWNPLGMEVRQISLP